MALAVQKDVMMSLCAPEDLQDLMTRTKVQIITRNPFYATLLCNSRVWYTDSRHPQLRTMATDGRDLYVSVDWVRDLEKKFVQSIVTHELIHKALLHVTRCGDRDILMWNIATDVVVNGILLGDSPPMPLPEGAVVDRNLDHLPAEEIYRILMQDSTMEVAGKTGKEWRESGEGTDHLLMTPSTPDEAKSIEVEVKLQNAQALAQANSRMPGSSSKFAIQAHIQKLLQPKVDWKAKLREFVTAQGNDDWTFSKPHTRYMAHGFYLPSTVGSQIGRLLVAIDTSGSIYHHQDLVDQFVSEVKSICEDVSPEALDVVYMDTDVRAHDTFDEFDEFKVNLQGGGGTAFASTFAYISELEQPPVAIIVFTDMEVFDLDKCQCDIPTLWMQYGSDSVVADPPFGTVTVVI